MSNHGFPFEQNRITWSHAPAWIDLRVDSLFLLYRRTHQVYTTSTKAKFVCSMLLYAHRSKRTHRMQRHSSSTACERNSRLIETTSRSERRCRTTRAIIGVFALVVAGIVEHHTVRYADEEAGSNEQRFLRSGYDDVVAIASRFLVCGPRESANERVSSSSHNRRVNARPMCSAPMIPIHMACP